VAHVTVTVMVTTVVGAGLVWLRMETGSIWAPLAVHAGLNMTMAVFARTAASYRPTLPSTNLPVTLGQEAV
jgi:membrane protease YdiL (CAAX protease family)